MNITYSTLNCTVCGSSHSNVVLHNATDGQYVLCPKEDVRIYDLSSWKKDSKLKQLWDNLDMRVPITLAIVTGLLGTFLVGCPQYSVWTSEMHGKAELARATSNRMIAVQEAEAKLEASFKLAEADIARAHGVARANEIIGTSLKGNEAYLRYLWIESLHNNPNSQVIYVPTEANLPILEANRGAK